MSQIAFQKDYPLLKVLYGMHFGKKEPAGGLYDQTWAEFKKKDPAYFTRLDDPDDYDTITEIVPLVSGSTDPKDFVVRFTIWDHTQGNANTSLAPWPEDPEARCWKKEECEAAQAMLDRLAVPNPGLSLAERVTLQSYLTRSSLVNRASAALLLQFEQLLVEASDGQPPGPPLSTLADEIREYQARQFPPPPLPYSRAELVPGPGFESPRVQVCLDETVQTLRIGEALLLAVELVSAVLSEPAAVTAPEAERSDSDEKITQ